MRRASTTRAFVAGVVVLAMLFSMSVLFGAAGSSVKLTAPAAKAKVKGIITVSAEVKAGKEASYAILVVDGNRPGSTNSFPASFDLDTRTLADGPHKVSVEVYDDFGLIASSKTITITVTNRPVAESVAKQPKPAAVAKQPAPQKIVVVAPAKSVPGRTTPPSVRTADTAAGGTETRVAGAAASRPLSPAQTVSGSARVTPRSDGAPERAAGSPAVAPVVVGRGPTPEPTRTTTVAALPTRDSRAAERDTRFGASTSTRAGSPPVMKVAQAAPATSHGHTVFLNGRAVEFDVVPVVKGGRMRGGFRSLFAHVGGKVTWRADTRTARSVSPTMTVEVPTGSRIARVNGKGVDMGSSAEMRGGRVIIPVRFFADVTGATLAWDDQTGVAHLHLGPEAVAAKPD